MDPDLPADQPLGPEELQDMKRHLRFVARYRTVLRPRLNAREARMVDGDLEPEHRGTCLHLLSKIDRGTILAALDREPLRSDAAVRASFLATAAGISGDVGILLHFLEALSETAASEKVVRAFTRALERIEFEELSAARLGRLLDVMQRAFPERELVGALFELLRNPGFRAAFDRCAAELDPAVAARFVPLRAVHRAMEGQGHRRLRPSDERDLARGLPMVLAISPTMLEAYPLAVRERLLEAALRSDSDQALGHPGIEVLLRSLPTDGRASARHGMALARLRLAKGRLKEARTLLEGLAGGPAAEEARALLARLEGPIAGPLALESQPLSPPGSLQPGFHLQRVEAVWLRFAVGAEGRAAFAREIGLQESACLPAVAGIRERGEAGKRGPFAVLEARGRRLDGLLDDGQLRLSYADARALAVAGARILRALALAGLALPDADPRRFLLPSPEAWAGLVLADSSGLVELGVAEASLLIRGQVGAWCHGALCYPPFRGTKLRRELPRPLRARLEESLERGADPVALVWELERAAGS